MANEIFRKTTGKGAVLVVSDSGERAYMGRGVILSVTVNGAAADTTLRGYAAPKLVAGKTVVGSIGGIGLTREEYDTIHAVIAIPEPERVEEKYRRADSYSAEDAAWDRAAERKLTGE